MGFANHCIELLVDCENSPLRSNLIQVKIDTEDMLIKNCITAYPRVNPERTSRCPRPSQEDITRFDTNTIIKRTCPVVEWFGWVVEVLYADNSHALGGPVRVSV